MGLHEQVVMECNLTDDTWGPWAGPTCRGGLDFTLLFEESIFSLLPSALLFLSTSLKLVWLRRRPKQARPGILLPVKQLLIIVLGLLKLALLILWALHGQRTKVTLAAAALNLSTVLPLCTLSYYEHVFNVAPGILVELYLFLTISFDAVRIRTLWLMPSSGYVVLAAVESVAIAVKLALAVIEAKRKDNLLLMSIDKFTDEQLYGLYGRSLFFWLGGTLWNGFHRFLNPSDLSGPRDDAASEVLRGRFREQWARCPDKSGKSALLSTLFKSMPDKFLIPVIPRLITLAITLTQPMLLERMLDFVQGDGDAGQRMEIGYALVGAFALLYTLTAVFNAWFAHSCNKLALELRGQLIDACYRGLLTLRLAALDSGNAATIINVDMQHIMDGSLILHDIWASIITVAVAVYLLYRQIQLAFIAPLLCTLLMTVLAGICSAPLGPRQMAWLAATEKRVKSTVAVISGFKEVKMLGLAPDYLTNLQSLRATEVELGRRFRRILSIIVTLSAASTQLSILVAFGGFAIISKLHGTPLTFQTLFSSLALLRISLDPLFLLIQGTPALISMFKCLGRVQDLLNDPRQLSLHNASFESSESSSSSSIKLTHDVSELNLETFHMHMANSSAAVAAPWVARLGAASNLVDMSDATFCWKGREDTPALYILSLSILASSFTAVIGPVGCGKSTLLKAILGEVESISGFRRIRRGTRIAFCDQEPWLMDRSVRENIVGSQPDDPDWYSRVIDACALTHDISGLEKGDETGVGSGGSAMSGGQRSRIALARAIYSRPELLLLDDIFSGLDRKSATHIFTALFSENGLLKNLRCAVVLVTHSTQFLSRVDTILVIDNGIIAHQGTYEELLTRGTLDEEAFSRSGSLSSAPLRQKDAVEVTSDGKVVLKNAKLDTEESETSRAPSDWSVYAYFLESCGTAGIVLFFGLAALLAAERSFENVWLKMWAENDGKSLAFYISILTALIVGGLALLASICIFFFDVLLPSSSLKLYFGQLETLMRSSISYVVSVGSNTIANRFIQDIMLVDDELPMALVNTSTAFFGVCAETVIVMISSKFVSISIPVLIGILWAIQKFYLRTSKQLRFMDIEAKAPLSAFLLETLQGIVSIRAFDRTSEFSHKNTRLLDYSQRAHYMMLSVQVWLKMILDFVVALLAVLVTSLAIAFRSSQSLGFLGLALVNLITLSTSFKYLITFWANLETSIGAVARIKRFNNHVEPEEKLELPSPHATWPGQGDIEFHHVSATYSPKLPPSVYDVSLHIAPGTKVAICGRSGSGKSSLLATILHCLDLTSGTVIIDGQDITRISRDSLRKRIMTLPQKALFVHGSIRANMTFWHQGDDSDSPALRREIDALIEVALRKVGLWDALFASRKTVLPLTHPPSPSASSFPDTHDRNAKDSSSEKASAGGSVMTTDEEVVTLDTDMNPEERLSAGQQQLFCLARALFQRSWAQILLMDEFTSSMDHETEMLVRDILDRDLKDKTVIEVLHRLQHILEFDLVVVMDGGKVVESGHPEELLANEGGLLRDLYQSARG